MSDTRKPTRAAMEAARSVEKHLRCVVDMQIGDSDREPISGLVKRVVLDILQAHIPRVAALIDQNTDLPRLVEACRMARKVLAGMPTDAIKEMEDMGYVPSISSAESLLDKALAKHEGGSRGD